MDVEIQGRIATKLQSDRFDDKNAARDGDDGSTASSLSDEPDVEDSESTSNGSTFDSDAADLAFGSGPGDDGHLSPEGIEAKMVQLFRPPSHESYGGAGMADEFAATLNSMAASMVRDARSPRRRACRLPCWATCRTGGGRTRPSA